MDELTYIAEAFGADKAPSIKHNYTPFYSELLNDKRESIKSMLEIGIAEGASLFMWRIFFPNAQIYGADNDRERLKKFGNYLRTNCCKSSYRNMKIYYDTYCDKCGKMINKDSISSQDNYDKIETFFVDQGSKESLWLLTGLDPVTKKYPRFYDLIVDDGSHIPEHQINTCLVLMPTLNKDGVYVIEDVDDQSAGYILDLLSSDYSCEEHKFGKRHDDRVIVVRHKNGKI